MAVGWIDLRQGAMLSLRKVRGRRARILKRIPSNKDAVAHLAASWFASHAAEKGMR